MNWDNLRHFLAVARAGSFVAAAEALSVSHTTVSRRMSAMEAELGVRLFERMRTGLVLTGAGERLLETARATESSIVTTERQLAGSDHRLFGSLQVTVPYLLSEHLLMDHFAGFADKYPDIELEILASHELVSLSRREADVAIRVTNNPPESAVGRRVATLHWALYIAQRLHRRCRRRSISPPYVGLDDGRPPPSAYGQYAPGGRVQARVNDHALLVHAVRAGLGAGVMARFVGEPDQSLRRIAALPARDTDLWLLTHADLRAAARVRVFMDYMHRALRADERLNACVA